MRRVLDKDAILGVYLTLVPFGGNVDGVRAASLLYFGKEPRRLSIGEAATLIAIPQAPEERRPDRFPETALAARNRIVKSLSARSALDAEEVKLARMENGTASSIPLHSPRRISRCECELLRVSVWKHFRR